jgi:hypothetical protein
MTTTTAHSEPGPAGTAGPVQRGGTQFGQTGAAAIQSTGARQAQSSREPWVRTGSIGLLIDAGLAISRAHLTSILSDRGIGAARWRSKSLRTNVRPISSKMAPYAPTPIRRLFDPSPPLPAKFGRITAGQRLARS